ncbi:hypothetical protein [Mycoplasma phocimorsus]|uniref:hypothetical protein n=1 Tax=Mycoplasma phocimorsus TaxID=3045839 RepID=UPI0024BFEF03|nr:hypothetical protein [Mycoplasma phocimorsus]MDJ1646516.1 hypothetical protein [Mycoplasma phocimorsus]MDJ1647095.1 hypothetical protein [Mycoplasma phocimorsus]
MNKKFRMLLAAISIPIIIFSLISVKDSEKEFSIYYVETDNIYTNNLTRNYITNKNTILNIPKTKEGYIFVNWVDKKYKFPLEYISSLETGDIILKPNLIKEYQEFGEAKRNFLSLKTKNQNLLKLLEEINLTYGYEKLKLQKEFTKEFNNNKLNEENIIENIDLEKEFFEENIKSHLQGFVSNTETFSETRLRLLEIQKPRNSGFLFNLFSNFGFKEYLIGGFISLFGLGTLAGAGYGIYKGIEARNKKLLDESKNYKLILEVEKEEYKNKNWSLYAFGEGLGSNIIGSFDPNFTFNKNINDKFTNEGSGKFSIRIENVKDPSKVNITLKISNTGAKNQTNSFYLKYNEKNNEKVYLLSDYYNIINENGRNKAVDNPNKTPLGTITLIKVI